MDNSLFKKVYYGQEEEGAWLDAGDRDDMPDNREGQHERTYMVQCWVHPASGMDVVEKNKTMEEFKFFLSNVFHDDEALREGLKAFEKEVDGFVLRPFFFKSFDSIGVPESVFMSRIRLQSPEARFASCQEIPNSK